MKRDPEKIFGIHPAEAAYRLTRLPPYLFRLIQQYALLGSYNATQQAMGINHKVLKVYFFRAKKILGVSKAFDVWRIYYAAQFLYLYQEDDDERTDGPSGDVDQRSGPRRQADGLD